MSRMFVAVIPPEPITDDLDDFLSVRRSAAGPADSPQPSLTFLARTVAPRNAGAMTERSDP